MIMEISRVDSSHEGSADAAQTWIGLETALSLLILLAAGAVRLWHLADWPLTISEAGEAMAAWRVAHGMPAGATTYSPFLLTGNLILFGLFRAGDFAARLLPALTGMALALSPLLFRRHLGSVGALAGAAILALSPLPVFASRQLDGRVVAALAGVLVLAGIVRVFDGERERGLRIGAVGLAIGLLSAPLFYSVVLILAGGMALLWFVVRPALGLERSWRGFERGWAALRSEWGAWARAGGLFLALFLLLGTAFFIHYDGLGAAADLLSGWIGWFSWKAPLYSPLVRLWGLPVYMPLELVFGIAGLVLAVRQRDFFGLLLGWWFLFGLVLSLAAGGWGPADFILLAVPLALLAGSALGGLVDSLRQEPPVEGEWLLLGVGGVLSIFAYIHFANYSRFGQSLSLVLSLAVAPLVVLAVAVLVWIWAGGRRTLRAGGLLVLLLCFAAMVHTTWLTSQSADISRQDLLRAVRVEPGVRDAVELLTRYGAQVHGGLYSAPVLVVGDDLDWLAWYLRDFPKVDFVSLFDSAEGYPLVLTPAVLQPPLGGRFVGQDIAVVSRWAPAGLRGADLAHWLLTRMTQVAPARESIILWAER